MTSLRACLLLVGQRLLADKNKLGPIASNKVRSSNLVGGLQQGVAYSTASTVTRKLNVNGQLAHKDKTFQTEIPENDFPVLSKPVGGQLS